MALGIEELGRISQNHMGEESRKARKMLLFLSAVCIGVSFGGILPAKISALGIDFTSFEQKSLIVLLVITTAFYLLSFHVYSRADTKRQRTVIELAIMEFDKGAHSYYREFLSPTSGERLIDTTLPKFLGIIALWSVLYINPQFSPFYEVWAPAGRAVQNFLGSALGVAFEYQKVVTHSAGKIILVIFGILTVVFFFLLVRVVILTIPDIKASIRQRREPRAASEERSKRPTLKRPPDSAA